MITKKLLTPGVIRKGMVITLAIGLFTMAGLLLSSTTPATWRSLSMIHPKNICLMLGVVFLSWLVEGWRVKTIAYLLGEHLSLFDTLRINLAPSFRNITPLYSGSVPTKFTSCTSRSFHRQSLGHCHDSRHLHQSPGVNRRSLASFYFSGKLLNEIGLASPGRILNYIILGALIFAGVLLLLLLRPTKGTFLIRRFSG